MTKLKQLFDISNKDIKLNTSYYNKYSNICKLYDIFLFNGTTNLEELKKEVQSLGIKSTYKFFFKTRKSLRGEAERIKLDTLLGLEYNEYIKDFFNINRYNFEKALKFSKISKVSFDAIDNKLNTADVNISSVERFVKFFKNNGLVSSVAVIKHNDSIEYYNINTGKTVAFKNYNTGRTFGLWDSEFEAFTAKLIAAHLDTNKIKLEKAKSKFNGHQYAALNRLLREELGSYTKSYITDITIEIAEVFSLTSGDDLEEKLENSLNKALKSLCNKDAKFKEALELDKKEYEIQRIEHNNIIAGIEAERLAKQAEIDRKLKERQQQEKLEREKKERELEEYRLAKQDERQRIIEERQEQIRLRKIQKQKERERQEQLKVIKIQEARDNYQRYWSNYDYNYYKLVSGLNIEVQLPDMAENSKRLSQVILRSEAISLFNINKDSNSNRFNVYDKVVNFSSKKVNYNLLNNLIENNDRKGIEEYLKSILLKSFLRLIDTKAIDEYIDHDYDILYLYKRNGGKRFRINKSTSDNKITGVKRNSPTSRGILICYNNVVLYGGVNQENRTYIQLELDANAFHDLCLLIGNEKPSTSEIDKYIELAILYAKSQRPDCFNLSAIAINHVVLNRDKRKLSSYNSKKTLVYIPCEYNTYIERILSNNKHNEMLPKSKASVLKTLVYEHLIATFNKEYIHI